MIPSHTTGHAGSHRAARDVEVTRAGVGRVCRSRRGSVPVGCRPCCRATNTPIFCNPLSHPLRRAKIAQFPEDGGVAIAPATPGARRPAPGGQHLHLLREVLRLSLTPTPGAPRGARSRFDEGPKARPRGPVWKQPEQSPAAWAWRVQDTRLPQAAEIFRRNRRTAPARCRRSQRQRPGRLAAPGPSVSVIPWT